MRVLNTRSDSRFRHKHTLTGTLRPDTDAFQLDSICFFLFSIGRLKKFAQSFQSIDESNSFDIWTINDNVIKNAHTQLYGIKH